MTPSERYSAYLDCISNDRHAPRNGAIRGDWHTCTHCGTRFRWIMQAENRPDYDPNQISLPIDQMGNAQVRF